jgi:hypothetical protein
VDTPWSGSTAHKRASTAYFGDVLKRTRPVGFPIL